MRRARNMASPLLRRLSFFFYTIILARLFHVASAKSKLDRPWDREIRADFDRGAGATCGDWGKVQDARRIQTNRSARREVRRSDVESGMRIRR